MSDIQRWKPTDSALIVAGADGKYVTYADHVAVMKIVHRLGQLEAHHIKPTSELGPTDIVNLELVDPTESREGRQP